MRWARRRARRAVAAFWTAFAVGWFWLGSEFSAGLLPWDEQIYFSAATNVLDGRWLIPHLTAGTNPLGGVDPFLEKPPLAYWIQAAAMAVGGETALVARIPSLLAVSGAVGITVLLACRLSRPATGVFAGVVAMGIPAFTLVRGAASVAIDPFLLLFGTGAVYALVVHVQTGSDRWAWLAGCCYGAAVLAKFVAAAPFGLFVLPYLYRYRHDLDWRGLGRVVAGGVLVAAPWFLVAAALELNALVDQMLLDQVVGRATGERFARPGDPTFGFMNYPYFTDVSNYFGWPSFALLLAVAVTLGRQRLRDEVSDVDVLMWPFAVGVVVLYAVVGGNHQWYVMPAAVPVTVIVADAFTACSSPVLENLDLGDADGDA